VLQFQRDVTALALRSKPLATALTLLTAVYVAFLGLSVARNDGHFSYSLDDAYIHMAMARNQANHGVFGVTPHGFTSSSSSPLWVVLVACCYRLFGVSDLVPFLFNAASAVGVILAGDVALKRFEVAPPTRLV